MLRSAVALTSLEVLLALALRGQSTGVIRGTVLDPAGAVIPAAHVTINGSIGAQQMSTDAEGRYIFVGLSGGRYILRADSDGFHPFENDNISIVSTGPVILNITLSISAIRQQVTVSSDKVDDVSLSSSANAAAIVLREADLEALPDDPDELAQDLKAAAGSSAGPGGSEFYVDGFSGGRLPPKDSIREVRINQNPFSAEYDRVGFGRIEVFTKPGTDKLHGLLAVKDSEGALNSRNPYAAAKAPYHGQQFIGELAGSLTEKSSFFLDYNRRQADDNAVIHATILDPQFQFASFNGTVLSWQSHDLLTARFDHQVGTRYTITGRYAWLRSKEVNAGIGGFMLQSRALDKAETSHTAQLTGTAVLGPNAINETRIQFIRTGNSQLGLNSAPAINVLDAFQGGGAQAGHSYADENRWELQNSTSISFGAHMMRFGARLRTASLFDISHRNFAGTFVFGGGLGPVLDANNQPLLDGSGKATLAPISSIERYRRTLLFQQMGLPIAAIQALGGGPSQFSISQGQPASAVALADGGAWMQDDWRVRTNVSLSLGLRWEAQSHIHDWADFAPRFGVAWTPGRGKTLIRAGAGIFYDRFGEALILGAARFDGRTQQAAVVDNPGFWPGVPAAAALARLDLPQTIRQISPSLRSPRLIQSSIGMERPLFAGMVVSASFEYTHGTHQLLSRNINAPQLASTPNIPPAAGIGPMRIDNIYQYESAGILNRNQILIGVNRKFRRRMGLFSSYVYSRTFSNTDGPDWFPANQYNLRAEYGRAATDVRHAAMAGGSILLPWRTTLSPFMVVRSGAPFNIITGHDGNRDSLFTDRPAFASDLAKSGVILTRFGAFDTRSGLGQAAIPRNFAQGPSFFAVNCRLAKTFGFGPEQGGKKRARSPKGGGAGFGGVAEKMFHDASSDLRYNVTVAVVVRNLLNTTNPGLPVGNLSSPNFGQSNWLASGASAADPSYGDNRRLQFQLRLTF